VGDALLAHELAHTAQQRATGAPLPDASAHGANLERDADRSAAGAMGSLLGLGSRILAPRLRSGLGLQRCGSRQGKKLSVCVQPVEVADDAGKNATTLPSFQATKDIWAKCCIDVSVGSKQTVSETDYLELDVKAATTSDTKEMTDLSAKVPGGDCLRVFVVRTFDIDGTLSKDHWGGGLGTGPPVSRLITVEGVHQNVVAHELGHAMGFPGHESGTVMEGTGAHNKANPDKVSDDICKTVRKFSKATVLDQDCTPSIP
jgi:hypothetical protein